MHDYISQYYIITHLKDIKLIMLLNIFKIFNVMNVMLSAAAFWSLRLTLVVLARYPAVIQFNLWLATYRVCRCCCFPMVCTNLCLCYSQVTNVSNYRPEDFKKQTKQKQTEEESENR